MRTTLAAALTALAFAATPAHAGELPNQYASMPGGNCKLAGTNGGNANNQFDARAIYATNRSTTSGVFVICAFQLTPTPIEGGVITQINLSALTLDGSVRPMACTAVIGSLTRYIDATYSSKTVNVDASGNTVFTWAPADFNGASPTGGIVGSAWASVTCNVPPQTAIALLYAKLNPTIR